MIQHVLVIDNDHITCLDNIDDVMQLFSQFYLF